MDIKKLVERLRNEDCGGCEFEEGCCAIGMCRVYVTAADALEAQAEEIEVQDKTLRAFSEATKGVPLSRVRELAQADREGRCVVFDVLRLPLIWGDADHDTILCPECGHDLMGGFPDGASCETPMYQCPYCGQPIDGTRALTREEAEAALAAQEGAEHEG